MRHFATQSGKSKGQFYTPAEVSRIMARVIGIGPDTARDRSVYDPTCGSRSLLVKASDEAPQGLTIFGQEMVVATWTMARMNMIRMVTRRPRSSGTTRSPRRASPAGAGSSSASTFAVANPPFSTNAWSNGLDPAHDAFRRFEYGVPPAKNGDYVFLLHLVASLMSTGKGAIILPHGVLFRGNREAAIRRNLVERGLIQGVIGLPANLFYGTGIPACIVVIDKENAATRDGILMIDASRGFRKDGGAVALSCGISAVPHGFRSSFRDWAAERTDNPVRSSRPRLLMSCRTRSKRRTCGRTCSSGGGGSGRIGRSIWRAGTPARPQG